MELSQYRYRELVGPFPFELGVVLNMVIKYQIPFSQHLNPCIFSEEGPYRSIKGSPIWLLGVRNPILK